MLIFQGVVEFAGEIVTHSLTGMMGDVKVPSNNLSLWPLRFLSDSFLTKEKPNEMTWQVTIL